MEFLKWVGSILLSIIGVSVIFGGVIFITLFGTVIWFFSLIAFGVIFLAYGIKDYFEYRANHRDS